MSLKEKLLSSLIALALLFSSSAIADIEEIIVTALKRETTLQDTPLAVTVVGAETIEQAAIIDLLDLGNSIPSFKFTQLQQSGQTNFWIRGFANGGNDPGIAPSVATYVDGAPRMRSINVISDLPDIERVEILKGPQSTLFGKNASAGVVNMTTKAPSGESEGLLEITLGNYDATLLKGMLGGAINDTNSYRFAFSRNKRDGYIENVYNDTTLNERDRWALRGQLLSELSDTTEIRLIIEADSLDELCCSTLQIAKSPISLITDSLAENVVSAITDRYDLDNKVANNVDPENKIDNVGATIVFDSELSFADLNAVLSTRSGSMEAQQDADQTSADQLKSQALEYDFDVNTLEVRLSSNDGGRVSWTTGMFYSSEDMKVYRTVVYGPDMAAFMDGNMRFLSAARLGNELGLDELATGVTLAGVDPSVGMAAAGAAIAAGLPPTTSPTLLGIAGAPALIAQGYLVTVPSPLGGTMDLPLGALIASQRASYFADGGGNLGENFHQKNETFSIYANFDVDLTKRLHLGVGFNYTDNSIEATGAVETNDPFGDLPIADDPLLGELTAFQYFPSYTSWPNADHDGTAEDNAFTHTVKLSYDLTDNMMVYASHSTGFKPKVLSMVYDSATRSVTEADGEDSTSVELGFKTSFEGGFLNIALFDQSIQDYHILQFGGGGFHLANAEEERHTGIEIDSVYALDENLILGFSAAKIEAEYESYTDAPCLDVNYSAAVPSLQALTYETSCLATNGDFTGFTPAGVPELAANLNLNYRWGTGDRGGYARIEFYYESEYALTDGLTKAAASRKQNDINASVGFNMGTASVRIWGRNLTDNSYLLSAAPTPATPGAFFGYRNIPRTYGVTLSNSF
tara:strand:- start:172 stop:2754 length:2583 start_codon:yes stop_codon:yes gene_type:complete